MDIDEIFKANRYSNLLENQDDETFLQYLIEVNNIPEELLGIYQSRGMDEIFIVYYADPTDFDNKCHEWDNKIMFLLNHGMLDKELIRKLRLNIVQILLYDKEKEVDKAIERSLDISRKITIPIIINGDEINIKQISIDEVDTYLLPFVRIRNLDSRINMTRLVPQLRVLHKSQPA